MMIRKKFDRTRRVPKDCAFCTQGQDPDYKEAESLGRYISDRGKISPRGKTGICAKHQRCLALAIKRGRFLGLLPFVARV